jgi:hypothetical protein
LPKGVEGVAVPSWGDSMTSSKVEVISSWQG